LANAKKENGRKINTEIKNMTFLGNIFTPASIEKKGKTRRQEDRKKGRKKEYVSFSTSYMSPLKRFAKSVCQKHIG
jgi:hypothetical protein